MSLWCRKIQTPRSHSTLCPRNQAWQPHAAGLAAECTAFGFAEAERPPSPEPKAEPFQLQPQVVGKAGKVCCSFGPGSARSRRRARPWPACKADFTVGPGSCALAQAADCDALGATRTVGVEGGVGFCLPPSSACRLSTVELFKLAHLQAGFLGVFGK